MKLWQKCIAMVMVLIIALVNYKLSRPLIREIQVSAKQELLNRTIVIDPGHGGRDNGAEVEGVKEDELNLAVALTLKHIIEQAGGNVILTRDGDYDLSDADAVNHKREDLKRRVAIMEDEEADLFISIHMNKYSSPSVSGAHVFYKAGHDQSRLLAGLIQDRLNSLLQKKKFPKAGNYFILNETTKPGVMVECGFLSNPAERSMLQDKEHQSQLAFAIYEGIVDYFRDSIIY